MSDLSITWLRTEAHRAKALTEVCIAPLGYTVTIKKPNRSVEQNAKFHALCEDLAKSPLEWAEKRRSKDDWKWLLVSGYCVAVNRQGEFMEGLEGERVMLRPSTTQLSVAEMGELISYAQAFCANHGVVIAD